MRNVSLDRCVRGWQGPLGGRPASGVQVLPCRQESRQWADEREEHWRAREVCAAQEARGRSCSCQWNGWRRRGRCGCGCGAEFGCGCRWCCTSGGSRITISPSLPLGMTACTQAGRDLKRAQHGHCIQSKRALTTHSKHNISDSFPRRRGDVPLRVDPRLDDGSFTVARWAVSCAAGTQYPIGRPLRSLGQRAAAEAEAQCYLYHCLLNDVTGHSGQCMDGPGALSNGSTTLVKAQGKAP